MTYNIKYDNRSDKSNNWEVRKPWVISLLKFHRPSIIGVQEALHNQVKDIESSLSGFTYVGVGRDDGNQAGEYSPIYYDTKQLELMNSGTFWLSETPEEISKGWDAALPRICTFAEFKDAEGTLFVVYNAHFDHIGVDARRNSASTILEHRDKFYPDTKIIFMGDLNFTDDDPAYRTITGGGLMDAWDTPSTYGPKATYNGFNWEEVPQRRIDYIFVSEAFDVLSTGVLTDSRFNRYPSDHFPVMSELQY
jgi:endonuclease/exonuclease/phosphatase family metal-dependent hydrolase